MTSIIVGGATTISNTGTLRIYNDSANAVDGTLGDWEFVEGESELYVITVSYTHLTLPTILLV